MCVGMLLRKDNSLGQNSEKSLKNKKWLNIHQWEGSFYFLLKWAGLEFFWILVFPMCFSNVSNYILNMFPQVPNVFPKCSIDTHAIRKWVLTQVENGDQLF
jgi:hypothetical protein